MTQDLPELPELPDVWAEAVLLELLVLIGDCKEGPSPTGPNGGVRGLEVFIIASGL